MMHAESEEIVREFFDRRRIQLKEVKLKIAIVMLFCIIGINTAWAENDKKIQQQTDLLLVASTAREMQFGFEKRIIFPFLQGTSALTSGNNITLKFGAELTPVSINILADTIWTPIAFLSFSLGSQIGSGWNYDMFGTRMNGMGLYRHAAQGDPEEFADGSGLDGAVWDVHLGAALQFDLAAIFPGDWNHVVMKFENIVNYQNYTKARGTEQWYFKADDGINQNTFGYYFSGFLGYQMPLFLDMVGFQFESSLPFYNPQSGQSLTNRKPEMFWSLLAEFTIGKSFNIITIAQLSNRLIHPVTANYDRQWKFYRVIVIGIWRLEGRH
ncbi:hypothetical protein AGMMS50230_07390 [Spirochaetia bacterium]|nr:hypothetical protein AGMMS50230_07390 [Spirochaetia bacterium]